MSEVRFPYNRVIHSLKEFFRTAPDAARVAQQQEIQRALDTNHDAQLTPEDFAGATPHQFDSIERLLSKHGFSLHHLIALPQIAFKAFAQYDPTPTEKTETLRDPLLRDYFTALPDAGLLWTDHKNTPPPPPAIADRERLTALILETAAALGYPPESLRRLSIHDAVLLSGRLVAHRLAYEHGMIGEAEKKLFDSIDRSQPDWQMELLGKLMQSGDLRNDRAKAIDTMPPDQIFAEGQGICRNYAAVNTAVFAILRDLNPQLRNTYMTTFSPSADHSMALSHAWNMVSTLTATGVDVTFVDPTWLDTRRRTADGSGAAGAGSEQMFYNALDDAHFGKAQWRVPHYLRDLFEMAGHPLRDQRDSVRYAGSTVPLHRYAEQAARYNLQILSRSLDRLPQLAPALQEKERQGIASTLTDVFYQLTGTQPSLWNNVDWSNPLVVNEFQRHRRLLDPELRSACKALYARIRASAPTALSEPTTDYGGHVILQPLFDRWLADE
ncbi:MAG: hypothetical protein HY696_01275 [Deltaproteobacteria bacterium]|nr:hypothetical protein [Deltaproteobacteria bacterium]